MHTRQSVAEPTPLQGTELVLVEGTGMYPAAYTTEGKTTHSPFCMATFGRRDWKCHRCVQLIHGAAPRGSWHRQYFGRKLKEVQQRLVF